MTWPWVRIDPSIVIGARPAATGMNGQWVYSAQGVVGNLANLATHLNMVNKTGRREIVAIDTRGDPGSIAVLMRDWLPSDTTAPVPGQPWAANTATPTAESAILAEIDSRTHYKKIGGSTVVTDRYHWGYLAGLRYALACVQARPEPAMSTPE